MVEHSDIRVVHRGGSRLHFREPLITIDSRFLICASGECVKVFSTSTEECIHVLHGHTDLVTGVVLNPSNHLQVYSCSADGTVRLWDFTDGILIKTFMVGWPIFSLYAAAKHEGVIFIVVPMENNSDTELCQLVALHLPHTGEQQVEAQSMSAVLTDISSNPATISFGSGDAYIAAVKGLKLDVYFFRKKKSWRFSLSASQKKGAKNTFTCISCHPREDCIATGHEDGKIRLWRNFQQKKEYTYSTLHWHHQAVSALRFTPEGTNLLSGGIEAVLVQWRYKQEGMKDFLPRLGAAIVHIAVSPNGELYCTAQADNTLTIIQSCVKVSAVIQGLVKGEEVKTDLMVDPRSKALVLNGKPGHLQFYSLQRDKQLYNLDIVQQEYIHELGLYQFNLVKAAFDGPGNWLATVEQRNLKDSELEMNLKLWAYDIQTQSFVLNTTVSAPHEAMVTAMCFDRASDQPATLVTASRDGHFKAWRLTEPAGEAEESYWSCEFVGTYHGMAPKCCCFSADGSLLAVSFQEVATVWSTASWELLTTLSQPPGIIRELCFGQQSCSKYLLGTTSKNLLCCWNLLTCSLEWSTSIDVSLLLADPLSENMAAFCCQGRTTDLYVFRPSEPRPLFTHNAVCSGSVMRAVFTPRDEMLNNCEESAQWLNRSQLYFLTSDMDLLTFITKVEEDRLVASAKQLVIDESVAMTPFHVLLGKQQQEAQDALSMYERTQVPQSSAAIREFLHTPAHVLPSASYLCSMFVHSLLISNTDPSKLNEATDEEMDSEKEEEDSEGEMEPSRPSRQEGSRGQESAVPCLTKAQARELRRVKKLDYSWLGQLLDT